MEKQRMKNGTGPALLLAAILISVTAGAAWSRDQGIVVAVTSAGSGAWPQLAVEAKALERQLASIGYATVLRIDPDRRSLIELIQAFEERAAPGDRVLIAYLGAVLSSRGFGYAVPAGSRIRGASDLEFEAVPLDRFLSGLSEKGVPAALFLDGNHTGDLDRIPGIRLGVAQGAGVPGTAIFSAGGEGESWAEEVLDVSRGESVFVRSLMRHLQEPSLEVNGLMQRVRREVSERTRAALVPVASTSLLSDWFPNPLTTRRAFTGDLFGLSVSGPVESMEVFIDDVRIGLTPLTTYLAPGRHKVRVEHAAWQPWQTDVEGALGDTRSVEARPEPNRYMRAISLTAEKQTLLQERDRRVKATFLERTLRPIFASAMIVGFGHGAFAGITATRPVDEGFSQADRDLALGAALGLLGAGTAGIVGFLVTLSATDTAPMERRLREIDEELAGLGVRQ